MDFFKRKEKTDEKDIRNLPELPGGFSTPMLPELPPLPSLPRTRAGDAMNLSAIKGSIAGESSRAGPRALELPESEMTPSMSAFPSARPSSAPRMPGVKEPVFVRIDRFKDAIRKFEDVKAKVEEIEEALQKIREIKNAEENELKSWESDVRAIKEKVSSVENSLFTKL